MKLLPKAGAFGIFYSGRIHVLEDLRFAGLFFSFLFCLVYLLIKLIQLILVIIQQFLVYLFFMPVKQYLRAFLRALQDWFFQWTD